ncbi:MAG: ABC transporter ATP-binding protein [Pirellulaceae bacterium]
MSNIAVRAENLGKDYVLKSETVHALRGVTFDVPEGDYVAIMGPSGSGKSTLLNLLGCLDRPSFGELYLGSENVATLNDNGLSDIRSKRIGFVFQSYNLIQQLNVVENIQVPLYYQGKVNRTTRKWAIELAGKVGLGDRLDHRPQQLSGGQMQRVAIARAMVNDPYYILADEATGNLDSKTTNEILCLFKELNDEGKTIIMVTHEDEVAARCHRVIRLRDGHIETDLPIEQDRKKYRFSMPAPELQEEEVAVAQAQTVASDGFSVGDNEIVMDGSVDGHDEPEIEVEIDE